MFRWLRTLAKRFDAFLSGHSANRHYVRRQHPRPKVRRSRSTAKPYLERVEDRVMLSGTPAEPIAASQPVVYQASPPPMPRAANPSGVVGQVIHLFTIAENEASTLRAMLGQEFAQLVSFDEWRLQTLLNSIEPSAPSQPPITNQPSGSTDNGLPAPQTHGVITPLVLSPPPVTPSSHAATSSGPKIASHDDASPGGMMPMVGGGSIGTTSQLTSSSNPSYPGQSVTFTDVVSGGGSGGGPTGTVDLTDGQTDLGSSSLQVVNGQDEATWTISTLALGSHSLTATYGGDSTYAGSSGSLTQNVNQINTTSQLTSSANPSYPDQSVTFTDIVSNGASGGATPSGAVDLMDGSTDLGPATLAVVNGQAQATWTVSTLNVGSHGLTATYSGDNVFLGSTATLTQNVNQLSSSVTLTSSVNPSVYNQSVTFTAVVVGGASGGGTPTGTMTFDDGGTQLGSSPVTVVNGQAQATWTISTLAVGNHQIIAQYSGDNTFQSSSTTLTQTVQAGPPVANDDSYTLPHDSSLSIPASGVLANDTDPDNLQLSAVLVSNATHGTAQLNSDGSFTYTPNAGYAGTDSFTYYATDGQQSSNTATVTLTVTDTGTITAQPDSYSVLHDQVLSVDTDIGVLANDSDGDGEQLTVASYTTPSHGTLSGNPDGSFTYTPNASYVGSDSFQYVATDGVVSSSPTTVTVNVTDSAPVAVNHSYGIPENTGENVTAAWGLLSGASDADGDVLRVTQWTQPAYGSLTGNPNGSFTYTPNSGYSGGDGFSYTISDGILAATAAVTVNVHAADAAPAANTDAYDALHDRVLNVNASTGVLANDTDSDGDPLTATLVNGPSHGTLTLNPDGSFMYTPNARYTGNDSFQYTASDGRQTSNITTTTLSVTDPHSPVTEEDGYSIVHDQVLSIDVAEGLLSNDEDLDNDPLTVALTSGPSDGSLQLHPDGSFTYTPNPGYIGNDSFSYMASDGVLASSPTTVSIAVLDTQPVTVSITASDPWASESPGDTGTFTVSRTGDLTSPLMVSYAVGGDAVAGSDYQSLSGTVVIPAGSSSATIVVTPLQDGTGEGEETVSVELLDGTGYVVGDPSESTVDILATPAVSQVQFASANVGVMENAGVAALEVYLDYAVPGQAVTVQYATADGSAKNPLDYLSTQGTLTFLPGETSEMLTVPINDDQLQNGDRTFTVSLSNPAGASLGALTTTDVTIYDDEPPTINVAATQPNAAEGGPVNGQFTITRSGNLDNDVTVYYEVGGTATEGADYAPLTGQLVLPAGIASDTVTVVPVDDTLIEGSETVVLTITPDINYSVGDQSSATVTIADDVSGATPVATIIATDPDASETGPDPGEFTVSRTGSIASDLTVTYQVSGTAVPGTDYQPLLGSVTIPAGQSSAVIPVNPIENPQLSGYRSVIVTLLAGGEYALGNGYFAGVSIRNKVDDPKPSVQEVHPLPGDFDTAGEPNPGLVGRILMTARYGTSYHTIKKTTAENTVAQTQDGTVKITAYLDQLVANVPVYFEVIDPSDSPRYSNKTEKWDDTVKDANPKTIYDLSAPNHGIENPAADTSPNDNRDPVLGMQDDSINGYNSFQKAALSQTMAMSKLVMIDDGTGKMVMRAVAEVNMNITKRFAGDNYVVRATTIDPGKQADGKTNKPFNDNSNVDDKGEDANIPDGNIAKSALLTAWWRTYYELDPMYRVGSYLIADAKKGDTVLTVSDKNTLKVGDTVRVMDEKNREPNLLTITDITGNKVTLNRPLSNDYSRWNPNKSHYGFIGRETGTPGDDFFIPDTSKLRDTFDDTYTEVVQLDAKHGSQPIPYYAPALARQAIVYGSEWFSNMTKGKPATNTFQLVGAGGRSIDTPAGDLNGLTDFHNDNISWVWIQDAQGKDRDIREIRDTTNHEVVHQFQWVGDRTGHDSLEAHDGSDKCLMNAGDILGRGKRNTTDDLYELSLDKIYSIRDYPQGI